MTGFQELEVQLLDAIERRGSRRSPRVSTLIVMVSSAMVVALAVVAIVALGHRKPPSPSNRPPTGSPPPTAPAHSGSTQANGQLLFALPKSVNRREARYIASALYAAAKQDPSCSIAPAPNSAGASASHGTPSATMLSVLGVLRRPATPADQLPAPLYRAGRPVGVGGLTKVYVRYVRRARVLDGVAYYVIPGVMGSPPPSAQVLNRCYTREMRALRGGLTHATKSFRAQTLRDGAQVYAEARAYIARRHPTEGVTELNWQLNGSGGGGGGGDTPATIRQQGMVGASQTSVYGVVPSGVARVTLEWPGKRPSLTTDVVGNVFAVRVPGATAVFPSLKMIWRSANGRVIKTVTTPG